MRIDDIPGPVRYHRLSRYFLDEYRPFVVFNHHVVFARKDLQLPTPSLENARPLEEAYFFEACDWGSSLHFSSERASLPQAPNALPLSFETTRTGKNFLTELGVPKEGLGRYHWLELDFAELREGFFRVSDGRLDLKNPNGGIYFHSLGGKEIRYRVPVGSCIQWKGFSGQKLFLAHNTAQGLRAARLVP